MGPTLFILESHATLEKKFFTICQVENEALVGFCLHHTFVRISPSLSCFSQLFISLSWAWEHGFIPSLLWETLFKTACMRASIVPSHHRCISNTAISRMWKEQCVSLQAGLFEIYVTSNQKSHWREITHLTPNTLMRPWGLSQHRTGDMSDSCVWLRLLEGKKWILIIVLILSEMTE